jgi:ketosteroid isomerase-like protein
MHNHLATINIIYEAFGKGDIPTILNYISDDVQWEQWADNSSQNAGVPWMQAREGKDGAAEFFRIVMEFNISEFRVLSIMGNEKQVAVEFVIDAKVPATGGHFRDEEMHLWTFDEQGKVIRFRHYTDTAKHITMAKRHDKVI